MKSSYEQNDYGAVFFAMVEGFRPSKCVELGVLSGYSTLHIAEGLKSVGAGAQLYAYDLFEDYQYRHDTQANVEAMLTKSGLLGDPVHLYKADAFQVYRNYEDQSVDFLHVDLSNNGDVVRQIMEQWDSKMQRQGLIIFEGGTEERDKIEWMIKYNKPPIKPEIENNPIIRKNYIFGTYLPFPGLTVLLKKV